MLNVIEINNETAKIIPFPAKKSEPKTQKVYSERPHEAVQPIKDLDDIKAAKEYLLNQTPRWAANPTNLRNYMMFVVNINNACRISDLLTLTIGDVLDANGKVRDRLFIRESKTKKTRYIFFGPSSKEAILQYLNALPEYKLTDHLFASRQKGTGEAKAISRCQAWRIIHNMGIAISKDKEEQLHLGTHSMRKTFGYQKIQQNPKDQMVVAQVSEMFNHSSMNTTYRYLGIDTETMEQFCTTNEI